MIKLSDYLDYLNNEIIQARKLADENAIRVAKYYAEHQYLKYFKVPRYSMPSVKMDVPLKIADIDADNKYEFNLDRQQVIVEINDKIRRVNLEKKMNIPLVNDAFLNSDGMKNFLKSMENPVASPVVRNPILRPVLPVGPIGPADINTNQLKAIKPINVPGLVKSIDLKFFKLQPNSTDAEGVELRNIVSDTFDARYKLTNSKLNAIFIDPDTSKNEDKDKLFLNLHVEMEEEGIRLVRIQDAKGNIVEEITFE